MSKIIAIANHKGGVGKTTSVVNIGAGFVNMGKKVLLMDLDPQANLSQSLGITDPEITISDSLREASPFLQPINIYENLDLIPSNLNLSELEILLVPMVGREYKLKRLIELIKDNYDFILIDTPPSLGLLTVNALTASQEVLIPLQVQFLAMRGLKGLLDVIEMARQETNPSVKINRIILTQYDQRKILDRDIVETITGHFKGRVCKTKIRINVALAEAPAQGLDIFRYNPKSHGAEDYKALSKELLELY